MATEFSNEAVISVAVEFWRSGGGAKQDWAESKRTQEKLEVVSMDGSFN